MTYIISQLTIMTQIDNLDGHYQSNLLRYQAQRSLFGILKKALERQVSFKKHKNI